MSIQEKIREEMVISMKNKDTKKLSLLRVVIGEFERIGKELSDEQSIKIIQKMHEYATELNNEYEKNILDTYIPKKLDESEIKNIVKTALETSGVISLKEMGKVMAELKNHPQSSQIDKKLASDYIKELLS